MRSIARRRGVVILRSELNGLGSTSQLTRVLANLVRRGMLVRVSVGVYAKTKDNRFTAKRTPAASFETIAAETLRKLGIVVTHGKLAAEYNAGLTTQIPMLPVVNTGRRRISRIIQVGTKRLLYEREARNPRGNGHGRRRDRGLKMATNGGGCADSVEIHTAVAVYLGDGSGPSIDVVCDGLSTQQHGSIWQRALDALSCPSPRGPYHVANRFFVVVSEVAGDGSASVSVLAKRIIYVSCEHQLLTALIRAPDATNAPVRLSFKIGDDVVTLSRGVLSRLQAEN